jgi:hypothetical protein
MATLIRVVSLLLRLGRPSKPPMPYNARWAIAILFAASGSVIFLLQCGAGCGPAHSNVQVFVGRDLHAVATMPAIETEASREVQIGLGHTGQR